MAGTQSAPLGHGRHSKPSFTLKPFAVPLWRELKVVVTCLTGKRKADTKMIVTTFILLIFIISPFNSLTQRARSKRRVVERDHICCWEKNKGIVRSCVLNN